jgi:hypothetical protein
MHKSVKFGLSPLRTAFPTIGSNLLLLSIVVLYIRFADKND